MQEAFYKGITCKLIAAISGATLLIGILLFFYNSRISRKITEEHARENAHMVAQTAILNIRSSLGKIESATKTIALYLELSSPDEATIAQYLRDLVFDQQEIYGATIAFDPAAHDGKRFAPYFYRSGDKVLSSNLADASYDYLEKSWYRNVRSSGKAAWSRPYFDEGGGNALMSTYSVPLFRKEGGGHVFIGVAALDMSLECLERIVTPLTIFKNGYGFMLAEDGSYITHPLKERMMNRTIFQVTTDESDLGEIGRRMVQGQEGFLPHLSTVTHKPSFVYFMPLGFNGWSIGVTCDRDSLYADVKKLNQVNIVIVTIGFATLLVLMVLIALSITGPLRRLAQAARQLAGGDFETVLPHVERNDEIGVLVEAFSSMRCALKEYIRNLMEASAHRERIESELNIARSIQRESLPKHLPDLEGTSYGLSAVMEPAEKVGGDLYDFFMHGDHRLFFVVGDVSGKGISAAIFMATTRILLKTAALRLGDPASALTELNRKICSENDSCMFVTLAVGMIDLLSGEVLLANAGHETPLMLLPGEPVIAAATERGPACGIDAEARYTNSRISLPAGATLLLYTDGVTEAENETGEFFASGRLAELMMELATVSPQVFVGRILEGIKAFQGNHPQTDDIALLAVSYGDRDFAHLPPETLRLNAEIAQLTALQEFARQFCVKHNVRTEIAHDCELVLEELFSNICKYAYPAGNEDCPVLITLCWSTTQVEWMVEDEGVPFNPLKAPLPSPDLSIVTIGGQGLRLVRRLMDELSYVRLDRFNRTNGKKRL